MRARSERPDGVVTCEGTAIQSATPAYGGTFDPATATLTWDSIDYAE